MNWKTWLSVVAFGLALTMGISVSAATYYLQSTGNAPWPFDPYNGEQPISVLDEDHHIYLVEDEGGSVGMRGMSRMMGLDFPLPGGDGTNSYIPYTNTFSFDTNGLWLELTNVSGGVAALNLHHGTNQVYGIYATPDLTIPFTNWQPVAELWPTNETTNVLAFNLALPFQPNGFLRALDWTGVDADGDGLPDWWEWAYFRTLSFSGTDVDSGGRTLLDDYQNGASPNLIMFALSFPGTTATDPVTGTITLYSGQPSYQAVLLDDTNFNDAVWQPYAGTNLVVDLIGTGVHTVYVGLRGLDPTVVWSQAAVNYSLAVPLALGLTNPVSTVSTRLVQVQGWVNQALSRLTYDVSNAAGITTNLTGYWQPEDYDTNTLKFTTNSFQCYDVLLTNGLNTITLRATDLNGLTLTTNFNVTLDTSLDTQAPVLTLVWPTEGMQVGGSNVTVHAQVDEATAIVTLLLNGDTNAVTGLVERDGNVWFDDLPLAGGTNTLTFTTTDDAGNISTTNLTLIQTAVTVTIDPLTEYQQGQPWIFVQGSISDPTASVTVNGIEGVNYGDGTWSADSVPVATTGTVMFNVQASGSAGTVEQMSVAEQPATVALMSYAKSYYHFATAYHYCPDGPSPGTIIEQVNWLPDKGGVDARSNRGKNGDCEPGDSDYSEGLAGGENNYEVNWENKAIMTSIYYPPTWTWVYYWNYWFYNDFHESGYEQTAVQTSVKVLPGERSGIGQSALYLVAAQVINEDSGLQLAAGAVAFLHQLAGTTAEDVTNADGSVWTTALVSAPAGAPIEVTPNATGYPNINFSQTKVLKTKEDWQKDVRTEINQDSRYTAVISQYLAENGFSVPNRRDMKAVYAFYEKLYSEQPTYYYWCGLAKLAGAPVYAGLSDAQYATPVLLNFQQTLVQMNIDILNDLAWQFEAYRKGGLDALEAIAASVNYNQNVIDIQPWRKIDQGIHEDNQALILQGNKDLLQREQQIILADGYQQLSTMDIGVIANYMSILAKCPVWDPSTSLPYTGRGFYAIVPGGNLTIYNDRWTWITYPVGGIWDTWLGLSSSDKNSQVSVLLTTRASTYATLPLY